MNWKKIKWPYSDQKPYCDWKCWKYGDIILFPGQWPAEGMEFVVVGQYSGFLKGFVSVQSAKAEIEKRYLTFTK